MQVIERLALQAALVFFVCLSSPFVLCTSRAQEAATNTKQALEMQYAEGLSRLGLADYAEIVIGRLGTGPLVKRLKLQILLSKGAFDKAKAVLAQEPNQNSEDAWAMKLALADSYYAFGKYQQAREIYDGFFQKYANGPPEQLVEFYASSGYKYAQMLVLMGQQKAAVKAFRDTLKAKLERPVQRQLEAEMADLLLKLGEENPAERAAHFKEVTDICNKLLWSQDMWFGKAIVMLAHIKLIQGDLDGARKLVEDYTQQLIEIDQILREDSKDNERDMTRHSPMAECRYLLGKILLQEAQEMIQEKKPREKIVEVLVGKKDERGRELPGALQHFLNVFVRYPNTSWAPPAGANLRQVEDLLKQMGKEVKYEVSPDQWAKVERAQMQEAKALYNNQQFEQAAEQYQKFLGLFPEGKALIPALTDLAMCYVDLDYDLYVDTVVRHLIERFRRKKDERMNQAGDAILLIASALTERKNTVKATELENQFIALFPSHPRAPGYAFRLGDLFYNKKDYRSAIPYYQQLIAVHSNSPLASDALSRLAACFKETGNTAEEIKALTALADSLEKKPVPGAPFTAAKYRLAGAYRELGEKYFPAAYNRYAEVIKILLAGADKYQRNADDKRANERILEGAMVGRAFLLIHLKPPENQPEDVYKRMAIKGFEEIVTRFPTSDVAPVALMQMGTLWSILENPDETQKALARLQKEYPNSEANKNARAAFAHSLLAMGKRDKAVVEFKKMFGPEAGNYTAGQILSAAAELQKAREYEIALEAYDQVLGKAQDRGIIENALAGKGRALVELKKYEEAVIPLEKLLKEFPNTGFTVDACMGLSQACSALAGKEPDEAKRLALFNGAVTAMNKARSYAKADDVRANSELIIARINELKAKAAEQYGPKERVSEYRGKAVARYQILLGRDASDKAIQPYMEQAFGECIPLMLAIDRWKEAQEDATRYLELFKGGKYEPQVRSWLNEAKAKAAVQETPPPVVPAPEK